MRYSRKKTDSASPSSGMPTGRRSYSGFFRRALLLALPIAAAAATADGKEGKIKVACIGNSITYGYGIPDRATRSYPAVLQRMLGDGYEVGNFGRSGATLLNRGHRPYRQTEEYAASIEFRPDIAVIHLGINDTDPRDWPESGDDFAEDYLGLIQSYREANPDTRIIIARLSPLRASHYRYRSGTHDWRLLIQRQIEEIAAESGAELIDFDEPLRDRENLITDGIHPDARGAELMAATAYGGITGDYGGLKLPLLYTSGMVVERDTPLSIRGTGDSGSTVTVTLDGRSYTSTTDNRGRWGVVTAPLTTGPEYTMTVSDGRTSITIDNILAGEVWLASGQSNMEFPLQASDGGTDFVSTSTDPRLRFFNMRPRVQTMPGTWDSISIARVRELDYYLPACWESSSPENAGQMSAIAYHFGRMLRDSLDIPVGIICNAIGGSTTESWVDMTTLQRDMPEATVNWMTNDYTQKWAQERAADNIGGKDHSRLHPYGPGYLFATGIRPLEGTALGGVIWYQGESNAHNIEVHERLFGSLVDSWRRHFRNPGMPFLYVQLSSLSRPSWPSFRDSQRRLLESAANLGMAVSSDVGDSLDVHPRDKLTVGRRLGLLALDQVYGHGTVSSGPVPIEAESRDGAIYIKFGYGEGMHPASGNELISFEVARHEGFYRPAKAEIINDSIIKVYSMEISCPRYVRYGWQPFTRANLVNSADLPASTFKIEAGNTSMFEPEEGIEYGVSGAAATTVGGRMIMAGGCNFPTLSPLATDAQKRFYSGIYAGEADGKGGFSWRLLGSLPEGRAYGGSAGDGESLYIIGGDGPDGKPLANVERVRPTADGFTLTPLPPLPEAADNMAACLSGGKLYAAGGNVGGRPSNALLVLDLSQPEKGWKRLKDFPGRARTQPVMAAANDGTLYLWGGFAGKSDGHDATLSIDGYAFRPESGKWTRSVAPRDAAGRAVSLGGGSALTLADGRIAAAGGVNAEIFLDALRDQAPDYLLHPAEWYRLNPTVYLFDPSAGSWAEGPTDPSFARAGASLAEIAPGRLILVGGELKPRIRSNQTACIEL